MPLLKSTPLLVAIIYWIWIYYEFVVVLCVDMVHDVEERCLFLIPFHFLYVLLLWNYFKVSCAELPVVPAQYKLPVAVYDQVVQAEEDSVKNAILKKFCQEKNVKVLQRTKNGHIRYCMKCKHIKPDRSHHCSICKTCVLKMDHHCPWVNNCVCFTNYKFFVNFLLCVSLFSSFVSACTFKYFMETFQSDWRNDSSAQIVVIFVFDMVLCLMAFCFFVYHVRLMSINKTTLEDLRMADFEVRGTSYNLGCCTNIKQVYGNNLLLWCLPISTQVGDGLEYPTVTYEHPV